MQCHDWEPGDGVSVGASPWQMSSQGIAMPHPHTVDETASSSEQAARGYGQRVWLLCKWKGWRPYSNTLRLRSKTF